MLPVAGYKRRQAVPQGRQGMVLQAGQRGHAQVKPAEALRFAPGDQITLDILRDGEDLQLEATLGERPADLG